VLKLQLNQTYGGATNLVNRLFFSFSGNLDEASALSIATLASNNWSADLGAHLTSHLSLDSVEVLDMGSPTGNQVTVTAGHLGTLPSTDYSPALAVVNNVGSVARRYRGGKPRFSQSGFPASAMADNQHWNGTALSSWSSNFNGYVVAIVGHGTNGGQVISCVNLSLVQGYTWKEIPLSNGGIKYEKVPTYRTTPVTDQIQSWVAKSQIGSQRRRGVN